jgi:pectate lyase
MNQNMEINNWQFKISEKVNLILRTIKIRVSDINEKYTQNAENMRVSEKRLIRLKSRLKI